MNADFKEQLNIDIYKIGRIASLIGIFGLLYFIYSDIYFRSINTLVIVRLVPISLFLIFFVGSYTTLKEKKSNLLFIFYYLGLFSVICMNYKIILVLWNTPLLHAGITALIVSCLIIYLAMRGSIFILAGIYLIPSTIFITYAYFYLVPLNQLANLSNPLIVMLIMIAIYAYEQKYKEEKFIVSNRMKMMAFTDSLTKLENRRGLRERLKKVTEQNKQTSNPTSIIMLDIDKFKSFNDIHGHDCGDFALVKMSEMLLLNLRKNDIAARWGGEEFMILLPNTDILEAKLVAEKVRASIAEDLFIYEETELFITVTLGICEFSALENIDEMIKNADAALYKGKKRGGNCVVVFD